MASHAAAVTAARRRTAPKLEATSDAASPPAAIVGKHGSIPRRADPARCSKRSKPTHDLGRLTKKGTGASICDDSARKDCRLRHRLILGFAALTLTVVAGIGIFIVSRSSGSGEAGTEVDAVNARLTQKGLPTLSSSIDLDPPTPMPHPRSPPRRDRVRPRSCLRARRLRSAALLKSSPSTGARQADAAWGPPTSSTFSCRGVRSRPVVSRCSSVERNAIRPRAVARQAAGASSRHRTRDTPGSGRTSIRTS